jgi:Ca-activated chloride channel homolog
VMNAAPARFGAESIGSPAGYLTYGLSDRSAGMQEFNTEEYDRVYENEFLEAINNPLSTFSIDVDTASYSNVRRYLSGNQLPPKDAVRIEEMINYFTYQYPQPQGAEPFSITTEMAACPWNAQHQLLLVGLQGRTMETKDLPASNLVFLVDVSGSMDRPNKLPLVQSAFKLLANQLRQQDKVSIVVYAGAAGLVLDSASGDQKAQILAAIDELKAGGSTAGGAGIQLAYEVAKKNFIKDGNNRVILATDGDFNVGVSSTSELERIIEEKRGDGIFLTVLGFGDGNYKDSRMETLADKGNGNLAYIDTMLEAKKVFVNQLTGTLFTIAKDVKIQVEFNPSKVKAYRLVGYENRMLKKEDFNNDKKDAGEIGAGHTVTALYEIVPAGSSEAFDKVDDLKYQKTTVTPSDELLTVKIRYKEPKEDVSKLLTRQVTGKAGDSAASNNLQFASAVAEFGMLLRDSQFKGTSTYQEALAQAKAAKGTDDDGFRADFIKMIEMAQMISGKQ